MFAAVLPGRIGRPGAAAAFPEVREKSTREGGGRPHIAVCQVAGAVFVSRRAECADSRLGSSRRCRSACGGVRIAVRLADAVLTRRAGNLAAYLTWRGVPPRHGIVYRAGRGAGSIRGAAGPAGGVAAAEWPLVLPRSMPLPTRAGSGHQPGREWRRRSCPAARRCGRRRIVVPVVALAVHRAGRRPRRGTRSGPGPGRRHPQGRAADHRRSARLRAAGRGGYPLTCTTRGTDEAPLTSVLRAPGPGAGAGPARATTGDLP